MKEGGMEGCGEGGSVMEGCGEGGYVMKGVVW